MRNDTVTLVLLPGLDGTLGPRADFVRAIAPRLSANVIAYPHDIALGYAALEAFVRDRLPPNRPFVLLGESFSGPIAIRMGAFPPPGLRGLILCGTFARWPSRSMRLLRGLVAWAPVRHIPRWLRASIMWGSRTGDHSEPTSASALAAVHARVLRKRISELLAIDVTAPLGRIAVPTLVLYGTQDRIVSARATQWLLEHTPSATVVAIEGPHLLLQTRAEECATAVGNFVDGLAGGR